jgi:hypothetical protein
MCYIVITRNGKRAGLLLGFGSEDDWLDYRLESDSRFLDRTAVWSGASVGRMQSASFGVVIALRWQTYFVCVASPYQPAE